MGVFINGVSDGAVLATAFALGAGMSTQWSWRRQVWVKGDSGRTRLSPRALLLSLIIGAMAASFIIMPLVEPAKMQRPYAWLLFPAGFALSTCAFLAMILSCRHRWEWDRSGLQFKGNWRSVTIPWAELESVEVRWDGQFCAVGKSGEQIRWRPKAILAREELHRAILKARPDLTLPPSTIY